MKGSRLHLDLFKVFQDLVDTGSFSKAAAQNHLTQSAVSQQLSFLERRLGARLIERGKERFFLTEAGRELLRCAWKILQAYGEAESAIRNPGAVGGPLRVEAIYSIGLHALPSHLKSFLARFPQVSLRTSYSRAEQVYEDLIHGHGDVGLVAYPRSHPLLRVLAFERERLAVACAPGDPLAARKNASLKDLLARPFVAFERGLPTQKAIEDLVFRRLGTFPRVVAEFDNVETLKRGVEVGLGITILPERTVAAEVKAGSLACVPFSSPAYYRPTGILIRRDQPLSRAGKEFVRWLTREAKP